MKKHPVDELFKSKLAEIEKKPSGAAWARLETSGVIKKRQSTMWYAVAAAVALLLLSGGIIWNAMQQSGKRQEQVVAKVSTPARDQNARLDSSLKIQQPEPAPRSGLAVVQPKKVKVKTNVPQFKSETDHITPLVKIAAIEKIESNGPTTPDEDLAMNIKPMDVIPDSVVPAPSKDRIVLVSVETTDQEMEPKTKPGRFAKVFKQLKNARAGEKVDWNEVGFNPKNVIARFDDKLKHGEQEVSERYQDIKEKTKL